MNIGKRNVQTFLQRIFDPVSYAAFIRMLYTHEHPVNVFYREMFSTGIYPVDVSIRTPAGKHLVHLFHVEDLSTLNLIFCRQDYMVPRQLGVVVDIGANIGISALFWLTRNDSCTAYLYEPVPDNVNHLRLNTECFQDRCVIESVAVSDTAGDVEFGIEESGKLGGIGVDTGRTITVPCCHIMEVLEPVLDRHGFIDCLKIDTEGTETRILKAIDPRCWKYIRCVNVEEYQSAQHLPAYFTGTRRGSAMRFRNTSLNGS